MKPKEKTKELVNKYWGKGITNDKEIAKACAKIAVEEIIKIEKHHIHDLWVEYWQEVRTEIENL